LVFVRQNFTATDGGWLGTIAWVEHAGQPRADSCLASRETKLDDADLSKLVGKQPSCVESQKERVAWLQKRLVLEDDGLSKLVQTLRAVLGCSIENNLEPKLTWLAARLELDDLGISKLVKTQPSVLGMSVDENFEPKLAWLKARLELDDEGLCKLVKTQPSVLSCSIHDN
jgi:hypothetical protein